MEKTNTGPLSAKVAKQPLRLNTIQAVVSHAVLKLWINRCSHDLTTCNYYYYYYFFRAH